MTNFTRSCSSPCTIPMHSTHRHTSISFVKSFLEFEQDGVLWNERAHLEQKSVVFFRRHDQQKLSDSIWKCENGWKKICNEQLHIKE